MQVEWLRWTLPLALSLISQAATKDACAGKNFIPVSAGVGGLYIRLMTEMRKQSWIFTHASTDSRDESGAQV